jgi:hypothetical protein
MKTSERIFRVLGCLVLLAVGVGLAWYQGGLLLRDFRIGTDVEEATEARFVKGECKSRLVLIHFCDLTVEQANGDVTDRIELSYVFVDFPLSDYSVRLLSPKGQRASVRNVTTDIGQEKLWNRAIALALIVVFCLAASVGVLLPLKGSGRVQGARSIST